MKILIDGECPLCRREGAFLMRLDRGRGLVSLVDIAAPGFDPAPYGITIDQAMGRIHAVTPEGALITGLEVFRRAYRALNAPLGWLWAPTGWPGLRVLFDAAYRVFARNRYRFGGGRRQCEGGRCAVK